MKHFIIAAAATLAATAGANAAVLDFVAEAAGNERGVADGTTINFGGIDVTFSATNGSAYFDDVSSGPGGLGVCTTLASRTLADGTVIPNQCTPSSDDSISSDPDGDEAVKLTFADAITLSDHTFNDFGHNDISSRADLTLLINVNDAGFTQFTFAQAAGLVIAGVRSIEFAIDTSATGIGFYLSSVQAVPLPAAAPFLLTGLAGLGFASRRKRRA